MRIRCLVAVLAVLPATALLWASTDAAEVEAVAVEVAGRVIDRDGAPVAGARVSLRPWRRPGGHFTATDPSGRFRFSGLRADLYRLQADAGGYLSPALDRRLDGVVTGLELVLTLRRIQGDAAAPRLQAPLPTTVELTWLDLENAAHRELGELLQDVPGVAARRHGPLHLEPVVRGLDGERVAVFIDDVPTFTAGPLSPATGLSHLHPRMIERLRVVKGPHALAWGPGTLAALAVETRTPAIGNDDVRGSVALSRGENGDALDAFANVWHSHGAWTWILNVAQVSGGDYAAGGGAGLVESDHRASSVQTHWAAELPGRVVFTYTGSYQEQHDVDLPGRRPDTADARHRAHTIDLTWSGTGAVRQVYGQAFVADHNWRPGEVESAGSTRGGRLRVRLAGERLAVAAGVDTFERRQRVAGLGEPPRPDTREREDTGAFVQLVGRAGRTVTTTAFRLDDGGRTSAAMDVQIGAGRQWALSAGAGRVTRAASPFAALDGRRLERSDEVDLGLRGGWGSLRLAVDLFVRELDGFDGEVRFHGGELRVQHQAGVRLAWFGALSAVRSGDGVSGPAAVTVAPLRTRLGIRWTPGPGWGLDLGARLARRQDRVAGGESAAAGWAVFDVALRRELRRGVVLHAAVENLTDETWADALNAVDRRTGARILERGRSLTLGFSWRFGVVPPVGRPRPQ